MTTRALGWVQDPSNLENLRRVVEIFDPATTTHQELINNRIPNLIAKEDGLSRIVKAMASQPLNLLYSDLVGSAFTPRGTSRCNGIVQAAIPGQRRDFILDWPADNYVRWAHALGFIEFNRDNDTFCIAENGRALIETEIGSPDERTIFADALLAYPPAARVIKLLGKEASKNKALSKFEIGAELGFIGESGFTHIDIDYYVSEFLHADADTRKTMKSNWEGSSDKYARMICGWLETVGWVRKETIGYALPDHHAKGTCLMPAYKLTAEGYEQRKKLTGTSRMSQITKYVFYEMLCTKRDGREYIRTRRTRILKMIKKPLSVNEIQRKLVSHGIEASTKEILSDLKGLERLGLTISDKNGKYKCTDKIRGLSIPDSHSDDRSELQFLVSDCRESFSEIPEEYVILIEMGFDGQQSTNYERKAMELLTKWCHFNGHHLGGAHNPDGILSIGKTGIIIDFKAYKDGFNLQASERNKMLNYLSEAKNRPSDHPTKWWEKFAPEVTEYLFLFVSGKFVGQFKNQLNKLHSQTQIKGAALSSCVLCRTADEIVRGDLSGANFLKRIACLDEVE